MAPGNRTVQAGGPGLICSARFSSERVDEAATGLILLTDSTDWASFDWVGPLVAIILGSVLILVARSSGAAGDGSRPKPDLPR